MRPSVPSPSSSPSAPRLSSPLRSPAPAPAPVATRDSELAPGGRAARRSELGWGLAAGLWALGYAIVNATAALPANPQLWWQLRQGELTLSTGHAVLASSWSWTAGDLGWIPNSWLWGALLALGYRVAGFAGVVVYVLLAQLGVLALAWLVLGRLGLRTGPVRTGVLVVLSLSMAGWANGQSELADYAAVFAFALVCLSPRMAALAAGCRRLALAAAAFVLAAGWENLHLGGLTSIAVFAAVGLVLPTAEEPRERASGRPWDRFETRAARAPQRSDKTPAARAPRRWAETPAARAPQRWAETPAARAPQRSAETPAGRAPRRSRERAGGALLVAAGAALGVLATPAGAAGVAKSLATAATSKAEHYAAWGALFAQPGRYNYEPALLSLAIGAAALVLVLRRRRWAAAGILLLAALLGCLIVRSGSDLVMLAVIAGGGELGRMPQPRLPRTGLAAAAAAAGWLAVAVCVAAASVAPGWRLTGVDPADLAAIPHGARVYATVGPSDAIDVLRPDLQVTIDSRNDLYPVAEFEFAKSLTTTGAAAAPNWFEDNGVSAVYLAGSPSREARSRLAVALTDAAWSRIPGERGLVLLAPRK